MLSKMAQANNAGAGGSSGSATGTRRVPLSLSASGATTMSRVQQGSGSNGRSNSPQYSNSSKKTNEQSAASAMGPNLSQKKTSSSQQRQQSASSSASSSVSKDEEKKNSQNGVNKSTNANVKVAQNGAVVKEVQKPKEKAVEKKEQVKDEVKSSKKEAGNDTKTTAAAETKKSEAGSAEVIFIDLSEKEPAVNVVPTTPNSERKSSRRISAGQQKSPNKPQQSESPGQKKQPEAVVAAAVPAPVAAAVEDVDMEPLTVDASPIRSVPNSAQPAATSTPGRNLFGFRSSTKQSNEVELAAQPSSSPATVPARNFAQISGRRSIRPVATPTPSKLGSYRCMNTSDLDTSGCSMNATAGSEIPNNSSFSFSFFNRGRKRERTPPPLFGTQSSNDLAQDVEMSPPKRARFELFSLNLASPFSLLRSRFSKTTISTPSSRSRHDTTPPAGEIEEREDEVQNVSGIVIQEDEQKQQLNKSSNSNEVTVGQEAGLETPKRSGSLNDLFDAAEVKNIKEDGEGDEAVANLPATESELIAEGEGPNRSRCAIM